MRKLTFFICLLFFVSVVHASEGANKSTVHYSGTPSAKWTPGSGIIIDNSQFILHGSFYSIDFGTEIGKQIPPLGRLSVWSAELSKDETIAEQFAFYGHFTSVNPFVLVAAIEALNGDLGVVQSIDDLESLDLSVDEGLFSERLNMLAEELATTYYTYRDSEMSQQAASLALMDVLGVSTKHFHTETVEGFRKSFLLRFGDPLAADPQFYHHEENRRLYERNGLNEHNHSLNQLTWNQSDMQLPWSVGQTWGYSGGPHNWSGISNGQPITARPWSSIDLTPPDKVACPASPSSYHVKASLYGHVYYVHETFVKIAHWSEPWEPRWESWYFHLSPIYVSNAQSVTPTTTVGRPSCLGGTTTALHVHFGFSYNGSLIEAHGNQLSGWTINEGSQPYGGSMTKGGTTVNVSGTITK